MRARSGSLSQVTSSPSAGNAAYGERGVAGVGADLDRAPRAVSAPARASSAPPRDGGEHLRMLNLRARPRFELGEPLTAVWCGAAR